MSADGLDALPPGYVIGGYELTRVLGVGGFGITYEAVNPVTRRRMAIKEFYPAGLARRDSTSHVVYTQADGGVIGWALEKFRSTTTALCGLDHPNIVRVHDYMPANGTGYMVMEYLEGHTVEGWLRRLEPSRPDAHQLKPVLDPVLDALAYVHAQGLIHRDIAPDNILITSSGRPVLIDFGALSQDVSKATRHLGTKGIAKQHYTAPEQARRDARPEPSADIYSIGAVLYRAMTGEPPVDGAERMSEVGLGGEDPYQPLRPRGWLDPTLAATADACLRLRKSERPQTVQAVREQLGWRQPESQPQPLGPEPTNVVPVSITPLGPANLDREASPPAHPPPIPSGAAPVAPIPVAHLAASEPSRPAAEAGVPPASPPPLPPEADARQAVSPLSAPVQSLPGWARAGGLASAGLAALALLWSGASVLTGAVPKPPWLASSAEDSAESDALPRGVERIVDFSDAARAYATAYSTAFDEGGRFVAMGGSNSAATLWDLADGKLIRTFAPLPGKVQAVAILSDRLVAAAAQSSRTATIWNAQSGEVRSTISFDAGGDIVRLAFTADGRNLLVASVHAVGLFDTSTGRLLRQLDDSSVVRGTAFVRGSRRLVGGDLYGIVKLWDLDSGKVLSRLTLGSNEPIEAIAVTPDGRRALITNNTSSNNLMLYEIADWRLVQRFDGHTDKVNAAALSPDGSLAVSQGWDYTVRLWSVATGRELARIGPRLKITSVYGSVALPSQQTALISSGDAILRWSVGAR